MDTSVSMVEEPCLAALAAATWKGHAAHTTTGADIAATAHCQPGNWSAGTIERVITGVANTAATINLFFRSLARSRVASPTCGDRAGSGLEVIG